MVTDTKVRTDHKIAYGTQNMTKGPAMTREQAVKGLEAGIDMVRELNDKGYRILATGEMGTEIQHQQCSCFCVAETAGGRDDRARRRSDQRGTCAQDQCRSKKPLH